MKKLLLALLLLSPISVFAGADTDRICADSSLYGKLDQTITVSYTGETVSVGTVWKKFYSFEPTNTYNPKGEQRLYYVVNIPSKKLAELYSYNCETHKPKRLLEIKYNEGEGDYNLDVINADTFVIISKGYGMFPNISTIVAYNVRLNRKLLTYRNLDSSIILGDIIGFTSGKSSWFIYVKSAFDSIDDSLYQLDKRTKKLIKL